MITLKSWSLKITLNSSMCNKVAWLDHGHLRRLGPTKEVTAEYRKFEKKDAMKADKVEG